MKRTLFLASLGIIFLSFFFYGFSVLEIPLMFKDLLILKEAGRLNFFTGPINVFYGALGNALFLLILIFFYRRNYDSRSKNFNNFFGITNQTRLLKIPVYLSDAHEGIYGEKSISHSEFLAFKEIEKCLNEQNFKGIVPDMIQSFFDSLWKSNMVLDLSPEIVEKNQEFITPKGTVFVIGSARKNYIREKFLKNSLTKFTISREMIKPRETDPEPTLYTTNDARKLIPHLSWIKILSGESEVKLIEDSPIKNLGVIERITNSDSGRTIFYCTGNRGDSTMLSAWYLCHYWREIQKLAENRDFTIYLKFELTEKYIQKLDLSNLKEAGFIYPIDLKSMKLPS
jgi:hypothetical protein